MNTPYTPNALRTLANLEQDYLHWVEDRRVMDTGTMRWRPRPNGQEYLYQQTGVRTEKSLGPRSAATEDLYQTFTDARTRIKSIENRLRMSSALCRTQRIPLLPTVAGRVFRALDVAGEMGDEGVMVVGTHAVPAYEQLAQRALDQDLLATVDIDLAWRRTQPYAGRPVVDVLKAMDPTWTINTERPFQAINSDGDEVELLVAPARWANFNRRGFQPVAIPEQDWLLLGTPVDLVVPTQDRWAARVVAPDPRCFALHKIFMSSSPRRSPLKVHKDKAQGLAILDLVCADMPHYPMDSDFLASVPEEMVRAWDAYLAERAQIAQDADRRHRPRIG